MLLLWFLKVWSSHPHLPSWMSMSIWTWFVLSQRSLLLTLSIPSIPKIVRKHWLTKVWILYSVRWYCSYVLILLRIASRTWHLCWTDEFSLLCRLPWTSTRFSKCGMLSLPCSLLFLRQPLSIIVCLLYYLDIWTIRPLQVPLPHWSFTSSIKSQDLGFPSVDFQPCLCWNPGQMYILLYAFSDGCVTLEQGHLQNPGHQVVF